MENTTVPLIINGKEEYDPSSSFEVTSPYTNTTCWTTASASISDAQRACDSCAAAFPTWASTKPTVRRDILLKAADLLEERLVENAAIMRTEMGADVGASQMFVVPLGISMLRDVAGRITSVCGAVPVVETEGQSAMVVKEPMGVILGITPWNAPYVFGIRSAACALAAGNATILKSSELTPRCYWAIARALHDAGLPDGVLNLISCRAQDAPAVVTAMIEHPAVRKVNFTGSTAVGRQIARTCGANLKPSLMELGGKNSAIVCADANIETAVQGVLAGALLNSGQICMSTDRILVHADVAEQFLGALKTALAQQAQQQAADSPPTLVSQASKDRVKSLVSGALAAGAHLVHDNGVTQALSEGSESEGVRMPPAILAGVTRDMAVWQEENFASLASCLVVSSDEEAIRIANDGPYGLSAAVFTEDLRRGFAMARKIETGAVHINSMTVHDEAVLPHGGVKQSGWGRFNASQGLEEFLATKSVTWMD